jgi:Fe-S-cluster containining protein
MTELLPEDVNPCLSCPDICCALKGECGLRLSQAEFDTHFKVHMQNLLVRREGQLVIISTKEGLVCPNLGDKGCRIYIDRPIDCRLYPYQMMPVYETRRKIKFMLYMTPNCVADKTFHYPEQEAKKLVMEFCRRVYGDKKIIIQVYENRFLPKLMNKCATLFNRWCEKLGIDW